MNNPTLKLELLDWLMHLEDEVKIKQILTIKNNVEDAIVAYTVLGEPLNQSAYRAEVKKGLNDIKAGRVKTQQQIRDKYRSNE